MQTQFLACMVDTLTQEQFFQLIILKINHFPFSSKEMWSLVTLVRLNHS